MSDDHRVRVLHVYKFNWGYRGIAVHPVVGRAGFSAVVFAERSYLTRSGAERALFRKARRSFANDVRQAEARCGKEEGQ